MITMKTLNRFVLLISLALGLSASAFAQTIPAETTLSAAVTNVNQQTIPLTSVTTAPTANWVAGNYLWVEAEAMLIRSFSGTTATVVRGQLQTMASPHKNAAVVYAANPGSFYISSPPGGPPNAQGQGGGTGLYCVRSQWQYLPQIDTRTATVWTCPKSPTGTTTAQTWAGTTPWPVTSNSVTVSPF